VIAILAVVGLAVVLIAANGARPDGRLHVIALDIGQGDAILLEGPNGGRALVDGGPDPDRLISLLDQRIPSWDRRLDLVVLTHPHEDHVAGLAAVLARYKVADIFEPGMIGTGPGDAAFRRQLAQLGRRSRTLAAGDRIALDSVRMDVIWPLPGTVPIEAPDSGREINDISIVLDIHFGSRRILLTGDAEDDVDPQLLQRGLANGGRVDLLKVAHHGSATASSAALLATIQPRVAVISVGADNDYGHPAAATLGRLKDVGAVVYRTDLDGTVDVSTNGADLIVETSAATQKILPVSRTYNRVDGSSDPRRGRSDPGFARAPRLAARPQCCSCRRRRIPGRRHRAARTRDQCRTV
jgi:competence protein ComEC